MGVLDQGREKYKTPREGTSKTCKRASAGFAGPQHRHSESFSLPGRATSLAEKRKERRRAKLLKMMAEDDEPRTHYWLTDTESDPDYVIIALAIRGGGSDEWLVPRAKYDPFVFLERLSKYGVQH